MSDEPSVSIDGDGGGSMGGALTAGGGNFPSGGASQTSGGASSGGAGGSLMGGATGSGGSGMGGERPDWGDVTGTPKVHCAEIAQLDAAPVIDGIIEPGVYLEEVDPKGWRHAEPIPPGNRSFLGVAWRPNGVYFFAVVEDSDYVPAPVPVDVMMDINIWQGDGLEFYVDHDGVYDAPIPTFAVMGTRQFHVAAPPSGTDANVDRGMIRRSDGGTDEHSYFEPSNWVSKPYDGGYYVELFIDAALLNLASLELSENDTIGVNFSQNVSGDMPTEGNRLAQYFQKVRDPLEGTADDYPFRNESTFCTTRLIVE